MNDCVLWVRHIVFVTNHIQLTNTHRCFFLVLTAVRLSLVGHLGCTFSPVLLWLAHLLLSQCIPLASWKTPVMRNECMGRVHAGKMERWHVRSNHTGQMRRLGGLMTGLEQLCIQNNLPAPALNDTTSTYLPHIVQPWLTELNDQYHHVRKHLKCDMLMIGLMISWCYFPFSRDTLTAAVRSFNISIALVSTDAPLGLDPVRLKLHCVQGLFRSPGGDSWFLRCVTLWR